MARLEGSPAAPMQTTTPAGALVARNTFLLVLSQLVTAPLGLLVNGVMGRYLGPEDFGILYLLGTMTGFAFLVLEWGQGATLTAAVARTPERSGPLVASALAFRLPMSLFACALCAASLLALGYPRSMQLPFLLVFAQGLIASVTGAVAAALRGQERIPLLVRLNIASALIGAALPVAVLFLGGQLSGWLWANIAVSAIGLALGAWFFRGANRGPLLPDRGLIRELLRNGTSFMILGAVLALQPYVDTMILARLVPAEVVGWHAASRKILGVLIFPSSTLAMALYPTLSRLHTESQQAWAKLTASSLDAVAILSVPAALGCALFADVGVSLFSRASFGPAADNLRMMSPFVFLVYFNIVLGTALMAANKQRPWAWAQSLCVLISAVADPLLIPLFQRRLGNGGLGVAVAAVASEILMTVAALAIAPRGTVGLPFLRSLGRAALAGIAMCAVALAARGLWWPWAMAASLIAYALVLIAVGGVGPEPRRIFSSAVLSKLRR